MEIRKANTKDVKSIQKIAESLSLNPKQPQKKGFLVYVLDNNEYSARINSSYFYVAEENGKILGFLMCYDKENLIKLIKEGEIKHEEGIIKYLNKKEGSFIFGDQIGILSEHTLKGIGKAMTQRLFQDMTKNGVEELIVCVSHFPLNSASTAFVKHLGLKKEAQIINTDGHEWDVYSCNVNIKKPLL
jgi:L-amino acid N-acyltransferase YncA